MDIQSERDSIRTPNHAKFFVNDDEGAQLLRISKAHFRRLVSKGELPSGRRLGRRRIWPVAELLGAGA